MMSVVTLSRPGSRAIAGAATQSRKCPARVCRSIRLVDSASETGLHRRMNALADRTDSGHRGNHCSPVASLVAGREPQPPNAVDTADRAQEDAQNRIRRRGNEFAVWTERSRLPTFRLPPRSSTSRTTSDQRRLRSGPRVVGNDAARAPIAAAAAARDPRLHLVEAARLKILVVLLEIERRRDRRSPRRAPSIRCGRRDSRRARSRALTCLALLSSCGPSRCAMQPVTPTIDPGLHVAPELAEPADHALLGVVADRARVDENDVRAVGLRPRPR